MCPRHERCPRGTESLGPIGTLKQAYGANRRHLAWALARWDEAWCALSALELALDRSPSIKSPRAQAPKSNNIDIDGSGLRNCSQC
jgi:hypothetical protein